MMRLSLLLTLALLLSPRPARAVFEGGGGDGFGASAAAGIGLDGTLNPPWPGVPLTGGDGDGFGAFAASGIGLDGTLNPPWPGVPLTGGFGDGHSALTSLEYQFSFGFGSPATYSVWQSSLFTGPEITGGFASALADFDGDGISNALEYALGLDPRTSSRIGLPYTAINDLTPYGQPPGGPDYLSLIVQRSPYAVDATISIEITSEFLTWTPNDVVVMMNAPALLIARDVDPVNAHTRRLMRMKVTLP